MTEDEVSAWATGDSRSFYTVWVADRFGDSGLTGLVSTECRDGVCHIVDFVLSCRVFGRQIEKVMTGIAVREAQRFGAEAVHATLLHTDKNKPTI